MEATLEIKYGCSLNVFLLSHVFWRVLIMLRVILFYTSCHLPNFHTHTHTHTLSLSLSLSLFLSLALSHSLSLCLSLSFSLSLSVCLSLSHTHTHTHTHTLSLTCKEFDFLFDDMAKSGQCALLCACACGRLSHAREAATCHALTRTRAGNPNMLIG